MQKLYNHYYQIELKLQCALHCQSDQFYTQIYYFIELMQRKCQLHSNPDSSQLIQSICLQDQCKQNRFLCFFCIHTQHQNHQMIFLKKQFSPSLFEFYQNLQKRKVEEQEYLLSQSNEQDLSKTNNIVKECDQLKNTIEHHLNALKDQYLKLSEFNQKQIQRLTPQKFIENIYQNEELIQNYVTQMAELKRKKSKLSQQCMIQLRSDYLETFKKLHRFSSNVLQSFKKKCLMTIKVMESKTRQKQFFMEKIDKLVQNRSLNYDQTRRAYQNKSKGHQVIDLDQQNQQQEKIDFVAEIQKNYLKRLKKTKFILKSQKETKLQNSLKFNDKIKKISSQNQKILQKKQEAIKKQKNPKKEHNQKKKQQNIEMQEFVDDLFGIPKLNTPSKNQFLQKKVNSQLQMGQIIICQDNLQKKQYEIIQQEKNLELLAQVNKLQVIKQNINLQPNSFSENYSEENTKNQITKIIDEQNQRQHEILKMGTQQNNPISLEDMPYRLFSIVIQNEVKLEQIKQNEKQKLDIQQKIQDQFFEPESEELITPKRRGRPPYKTCSISKNQKVNTKKNNKLSQLNSSKSKSVHSQSEKTQYISIKKVVLQCYDHEEVDKSLQILNKKQVKQLYISTDCMESAIDQETVNIIIQMKNLQKLYVFPCSNIQEKQFMKLVKNLKKLRELVLHQFNKFSLQCAEYVVKYLPNLQKISFTSDYMSHMRNIQDNYQFLNSFIIDSTLKKYITLSSLNNLKNLSLVNVGFLVSLQSQVKKIANKMNNLKQLCLIQTQSTKPINYEGFFQHLSKNKQIKLNSIVLQNILFFETNLIQILSQSQFLHTFMIHECPKQFGNKSISALAMYCQHLQQLSIFQNDTITGQQIFELKELKILSLRGTWGINKEVFSKKILKLKNLQRLLLNCNNFWFDDSLMSIICNIQGLKTLNIDFTKVTDNGLQNLKKLQNLETFICGNTQITTEGLVKVFQNNTQLSNSIKKLGLNKTKTQIKLNNKSTPYDINIKQLNCQLLNTLGTLLPNLTHIALQGVQKIFKENIITFKNLKCIKYNEESLTHQAEEELNRKWVFLNQNPW